MQQIKVTTVVYINEHTWSCIFIKLIYVKVDVLYYIAMRTQLAM